MPPAGSISSTVEDSESSNQAGTRSRLVRDLKTVPNLLSLSRILCVIAAVALYWHGFPIVGLIVGFWCGLSDYLDGWLARRSGQVTELGSILDRLGDLVFEITAFLFAIHVGILSPFFFAAYLLREVFVMSARQYVSEHKDRGIEMKASIFGKLKTNAFGYSYLTMFIAYADVLPMEWLDELFSKAAIFGVWCGLVFAYISGYQYLATFVRAYDAEGGRG